MAWGAIIIGSGIGGLTTAAYLAANGVRTLVLEQYDTVGGYSQVFRRKRKFEFDVGVHYIGDCAPGGGVTTALRGIGLDDRIEFNQLDPDGFTTIVFPGLEFRVPAGWDSYRERLIAAFPAEERNLRICLAVLERMGREVDEQGARRVTRVPVGAPVSVALGMLPVTKWFDLCRLSPEARAVILGEWGDYAAAPSRTPLVAHAYFMYHYLKAGAFYPRGGGQVIPANLLDVIRSHGGSVRTQARVKRIIVEGGRAVGVQLENGEVVRAPVVVSNADPKRTYLELVGREHLGRLLARRVGRYRMAFPICPVYLGLDIDLADRMGAIQYWAHTTTDLEGRYRHLAEGRFDPDFPLYVTSTTLKEPDYPHAAPPGHSSLMLMAVMPSQREFWGVGAGPAAGEKYSRNRDYLEVKERFTEALIARAAKLIPGLEEHIVWREAGTPLTNERYTLSSDGACYGLEASIDQFGLLRPGAKSRLPGLYLAGASTLWGPGIANTMFGGIGTASAILGRDLLSEIRAGRVFADRASLPVHGPDWDPLFACRRLAQKPRSRQPTGRGEPVPERSG